jgi:flagellar hook-associated protein 2
MSLAIDGLVSGLDTTSLINSLMQLEAAPQTLLKNRVSASQTLVTALQGLNSSVANLATAAGNAAKPTSTDLFKATSSASSITVSASSGATAGRIDLSVTSTAKAQVSVTAALTEWPDDPPTFTIVAADGSKTELTAASTSIEDIAEAINNAGAGVAAVRVAAGIDAGSGDPLYRLQLTSTETGADAAFSIYRGTEADVTAMTAPNLLALPGSATVTAASDASVTLWAGTPAEQIITSATNTFSDLLPGVSVTVSAVELTPAAITVARDTTAVSKVASGLVDSIKASLSFIDARSAVTPGSSGSSATTAGVFVGNATVREVNARILTAATAPVGGRSPSEIGMTLTKDGSVTFDEAKFSAAYAADPVATTDMMRTIASRVEAAGKAASDKFGGSISNLITGQQSSIRSTNDQIASWDDRLNARRVTLERVYAALETQLSNLNAQSSWLSAQVAALPTSGTTS